MFYVVTFYPIKVWTCLALQNDRQNLCFVKEIYVAGKKCPEMVINAPNLKVLSFESKRSIVWGIFFISKGTLKSKFAAKF